MLGKQLHQHTPMTQVAHWWIMAGQTLTLRITPSAADCVEIVSASRSWRLDDGRVLAVIAGPHALDHTAVVQWMDAGCPDPAPVRQGFAAILVDPRSGSTQMASGARSEVTLHWALEGQSLLVSSHLRALLEAQATPTFDEEGMARYLWRGSDPSETMYAGVTRLPAGHHARWRPGTRPHLMRWFWPQRTDVSTAANFPGQLGDVIADAVRQSLPSGGTVASHLSGGLDSTTVTALAAAQVRGHGGTIQALSHLVTPERWPAWLSPDADDSPFVEAFVRGTPGVQLHRFDTPRRSILSATRAVFEATAYPMLNPINAPWLLDIDDWVRANDVALVLTGVHGSLGFSITRGHQYRRAIRSGQFGLLKRDMVARHRLGDRWRHIGATTVYEFAPRATTTVLRVIGRHEPRASTNPLIIAPKPTDMVEPGVHKADREWWSQSVLLDQPAQSLMQFPVTGAWASDPLGDSEVIRTLFSAPASAWLGDGMDRALARRTMQGVVVDEVRLRAGRGLQGADFGEAARSQDREFQEALEEVSASPLANRFIDVPRLASTMRPHTPYAGRSALDWQLLEGRMLGFGLYLAWIEGFLRR